MDKPQIFLDKLKDYDLIPEDTYEVRHWGGHRVTQLLWRTPSGRIWMQSAPAPAACAQSNIHCHQENIVLDLISIKHIHCFILLTFFMFMFLMQN